MKKLKVVAMPSQKSAISEHRMVEPLEEMERQGLVENIGIFESKNGLDFEKATLASSEADILWFQCILSQPFLAALLNARVKNPKLKLVLDVDDNVFDINPWNPVYGSFTMKDVEEINGHLVPFPKERNVINSRYFETFLMEADAIIVTTRMLANIYYPYNKNIYTMTNTLLFERWNLPHVHRRVGNRVRIGWQGGNTHSQDWLHAHASVRDTLLMRQDVELEWITCPYGMEAFMKEFPKDKFRMYDFKHYDSHCWRHNCLRPDIGLAPLNEDAFSVCKSDLKTVEYMAMGVPVIASNISPYKDGVIHKETGFLASNKEEWDCYLNELINNRTLRKKIGKNAFAWAYENRRLEKSAKDWYDILCSISEVEKKWLIHQAA